MNKKQIEKEFEKIKYELRINKPAITPYPPDIVKRREHLLFAQVHLNNILGAKLEKDKWSEKFETEMYNNVMDIYYNWDKKNNILKYIHIRKIIMLNRQVVKEFLKEELKDSRIEIPEDISFDILVETFCKFTEDDLYEWLKDNYKSFFNHNNPDWKWLKDRIENYSN